MCWVFFLMDRFVFGFFFFFQAEDGIRDVAVTGVQTCALPILWHNPVGRPVTWAGHVARKARCGPDRLIRSEEHTSELQSRLHLVCRLLLEKKKKKTKTTTLKKKKKKNKKTTH